MKIKGTKTEVNLATAFAGECMAKARYTFYANKAKKEGYKQISEFFIETAENENEHAKIFLKYLQNDESTVPISSNDPNFSIGSTLDNLDFAADGEHEEWSNLYPSMAEVAESENFPQIAAAYRRIAEVEKAHEERYRLLAEQIFKNFKHWLEKEVFPLLLDMCEENYNLAKRRITSNENFLSINKYHTDFSEIVEKVIKIRPSNLFLFKDFCDDIRGIVQHNIFTTKLIQDAFTICKENYIKSVATDDLQYFLNEAKNGVIPTYLFPINLFTDQVGLTNSIKNGKTKDSSNISIILLSALFGSFNIFYHFMNESDFLQIKTTIGDDLIIYSIIGGNHKILQTLKRLNFELFKHIDKTIIYHRNDICIWMINQYISNIDINHLINLANQTKELHSELLIQLNQMKNSIMAHSQEESNIPTESKEMLAVSRDSENSVELKEKPAFAGNSENSAGLKENPAVSAELDISAGSNEQLDRRGGKRLNRRGMRPRNY